jgi:hypothetical protein
VWPDQHRSSDGRVHRCDPDRPAALDDRVHQPRPDPSAVPGVDDLDGQLGAPRPDRDQAGDADGPGGGECGDGQVSAAVNR